MEPGFVTSGPARGSGPGSFLSCLTSGSIRGPVPPCAHFLKCCSVAQTTDGLLEFPCVGMSSGELIDRMGSERPKLESLSYRGSQAFAFDNGESSEEGVAELEGTLGWGRKRSTESAMDRTKSLADGRLLDQYVLGTMLGQGSFGIVFGCRRKNFEDNPGEFAVKLIDKVETRPEDIAREVKTQQRLDHPNILKVHEVLDEKCFVCVVTDRYWGGDLVMCLKSHAQAGRRIRSSKITHLVRQMLDAIAHLHQLFIVHRDIKADNFMLDRVTLTDSKCRVVLGDFGFVCECRLGDRLSRRCGTRAYWPPELWDKSYTTKVDLWAMGVTLFGIVEGQFPFNNEWDVKNKEAQCHPLLNSKCADLIHQLLSKVEVIRPTASQARAHKWLCQEKDGEEGNGLVTEGDIEWRPELASMLHDEPDPNVTTRRLELVERLEGMHKRFYQMSTSERGQSKTKLRWSTDESSIDSANATPVAMLSNPHFAVFDKLADKIRTFEWRPEVEIGHLIAQGEDGGQGITQAPSNTELDLMLRSSSAMLVGQILETHGIVTALFGQGSAKTLERFAVELETGASQLMMDAAQHKALVRVVEVVLLRLSYQASQSGERQYLIVTADEQLDGRMRSDLNRLPGTKKRPHENVRNAAERIIMETPDIDIEQVAWNFDIHEAFEEEEESPSYPGVRTVYRKEVVTGQVLNYRSSGSGDALKPHRSSRSTKFFTWLTETECESKGVKLWTTSKSTEGSSLVPAPIGLKVKALGRFLKANKVDVSAFGRNRAKTLQELSTELMAGECSLRTLPNGGVARIVDVVLLKITNQQGDASLVVAKEASITAGGRENLVNRMPGTKRRPDENQFHAAKRVLQRQLKIPENLINLEASNVRLYQEEKDSPSYPGLRTVYCKRIITAQLLVTNRITGGGRVVGRTSSAGTVSTIGTEGRPQAAPSSARYCSAMLGR